MSSDISSISGVGAGVAAPSVLQIKARHLIRPPTPDTIFTERHNDPDITIFCESCHEYVSVRTMQEHRAFHGALVVLEYKGKQQPESVKALLKRRQTLTRDLNKNCDADNPAPFHRLQKINEAYELAKAHLEDTYEELIHTKEKLVHNCQGISLNCSAPCVRAVGICSDDNCRWKSKMEDTRVFQDYFGNDVNKCFFGIYDGYNGRFTADIASNDLHHIFLNELQKVDDSVSCTCSVNLADKNDLASYDLDRKTPIVRSDSIRHILHEESVNIIQQIMHTCESNLVLLNDPDGSGVDTPVRKKRHRDPEAENIAQAFHTTYHVLDRHMSYGINETSLVRWSGCSALTLLVQSHETTTTNDKEIQMDKESSDKENNVNDGGENEGTLEGEKGKDKVVQDKDDPKDVGGNQDSEKKEGEKEKELPELEDLGVVHLANAGNCHAVLCRAGKAYRLSKNHTPSNASEKTRVQRAASSIQAGGLSGRVNGILDTTRGLGNYGDPHLKKAVIPDPYTTSVKIDQFAEFVVMASCGLWDVLTDEDVVSLVKQTLAQRQARAVTGTMPDMYAQAMSEATTFGEDFDDSFNNGLGLGASFGQLGFEDAVASVIDIDAAEDVDGLGARHQYKNPDPNVGDGNDANGENDDEAKSLITWNEPLSEGGKERKLSGEEGKQQNGSEQKQSVRSEKSSRGGGSSAMRNFKEEFNDASSTKTDFESMLSALCDDGNEADVETLTEIHTFYAKSRLSEGLGLDDKKEEYRLAAEAISERLVQSALLAGSRDNITVMVILLDGCSL